MNDTKQRGGKREGAGRPFGSKTTNEENALSVQVAVRMTISEKAQLEERAKKENLTVSKYIHEKLFPES